MKKAFVLIAIAALLVCIIPTVDSSDADTAASVSGYVSAPRDLTVGGGTNITIRILYSADGSTGKVVGTTHTVSPQTVTTIANKFEIPIDPEADRVREHYYIYFNIYGYSVSATPTGYEEKVTIETAEEIKYTCYKMSGADIVNGDNPIGTASSGWFNLKVAEGVVTGKVSTKTDEPVYLNGVTVTLYDLEKKNELKSTTTGNGGEYSLSYSTGSYVIKFELGGYQSEEMEVVITEETPAIKNATLKETQSFFGVDLPHALMIIGGSLAVILLVFTLFMRLRLSKR